MDSDFFSPTSPPLCAVNVFGITPLYKYARTKPKSSNYIQIFDQNFETKFKDQIINSLMHSTLADVLHAYRGDDKLNLSHFYGNLHIDSMHYVSVFIDVDERIVHTCDHFSKNSMQ